MSNPAINTDSAPVTDPEPRWLPEHACTDEDLGWVANHIVCAICGEVTPR